MVATEDLARQVGVAPACKGLGVDSSSVNAFVLEKCGLPFPGKN